MSLLVLMRQFPGYIERGRPETSVDLPAMTSLALVGGIYELLYSEILHGATGKPAQPPSRRPVLGGAPIPRRRAG